MILIGITSETIGNREVDKVKAALDAGFNYIHIRKPLFSDEEMADYLKLIPSNYYPRLTLGSNYSLINEFPLGGIHIKEGSNIDSFLLSNKRTSRSCHTIEEIVKYSNDCDYVFLSPIFNSISKDGYLSRFTDKTLTHYSERGLLRNTVALGGINNQNLAQISKYGFYGAAILGYLFADISNSEFTKRLTLITSNNYF